MESIELEIEAVSKCKKQELAREKKSTSFKQVNNLQYVPYLDENTGTITQSSIHSKITELQLQQQDQQDYDLRDFEDSNFTKHLAQQIITIKILTTFIAGLSILLSGIGRDIAMPFLDQMKREYFYLICHSVLTASLLMLIIMKHVLKRQLTKRQLIKFSAYQMNLGGIHFSFLFELVFLTIHPNILTNGIRIRMQEPIFNQYQDYQFNRILQIIMILRMYLFYSAIFESSIYMSTRANRVCRIYGTKCDMAFGMKCVYNQRPLFFFCVLFFSSLIAFSEMLRISEEDSEDSGLGVFQNSIWCVIITMSTVGYGDYYPTTYLGRAIIFMASIAGIILSSLIILTLSTYLSMYHSEVKAHITLLRLNLRNKLEFLSGQVVKQTFSLSKLHDENPVSFKDLRKKSDQAKYTLRKIKNLIDTNNINEELDRLFESLSDNMKSAYLNQLKYSQALKELAEQERDKIRELQFSFTEEIENIIKGR